MIKQNILELCTTPELIENYEQAVADTTQVWECHHRLQTHTSDGERRLVDITAKELKALDMYYNRPAEELIFLTKEEHGSLHHKGKTPWNKGKHLSEKTRKKLSNRPFSEEWKNNISKSKGGKLIKCVESGEVHYSREWARLGFRHALDVALGIRKSCHKKHFELS